jgi:hypothetical protein
MGVAPQRICPRGRARGPGRSSQELDASARLLTNAQGTMRRTGRGTSSRTFARMRAEYRRARQRGEGRGHRAETEGHARQHALAGDRERSAPVFTASATPGYLPPVAGALFQEGVDLAVISTRCERCDREPRRRHPWFSPRHGGLSCWTAGRSEARVVTWRQRLPRRVFPCKLGSRPFASCSSIGIP